MDHLQGETFIVDSVKEAGDLYRTIAAAHGIETVFLGTGNPCYSPYVMHRWSHMPADGQNMDYVVACPQGDFPDERHPYWVQYPR